VTGDASVLRFDRTERMVHWANAALFGVLVVTGTALRIGDLAAAMGGRPFLKVVHVYAGLALPVPVVGALVTRAGAQFRRDLARLNRWTEDDRRWWSPRTRPSARLGKFNPGQKLNAAFVGASIVVMFATGLMLWRPDPFSDDLRTGATFVHDSTWLALCIVIAGHIWFALRDPDALRAITLGWVTEAWARRERPRWWAEVAAGASGSAGAIGDVDAGAQQRVDERRVRAREVTVGDGEDPRAGDRLGGLEL
jgi:formate dehydrogenase subunit gamma